MHKYTRLPVYRPWKTSPHLPQSDRPSPPRSRVAPQRWCLASRCPRSNVAKFQIIQVGGVRLEPTKIITLIEELRNELHKLYESKDLTNLEVIKKSRELDELLVRYQEMLIKRKDDSLGPGE